MHAQCLVSLLLIFSEGQLKVLVVKIGEGCEEAKVRLDAPLGFWQKGGVTPRNGNIRKNERPGGPEEAEWSESWVVPVLAGVREAEVQS